MRFGQRIHEGRLLAPLRGRHRVDACSCGDCGGRRALGREVARKLATLLDVRWVRQVGARLAPERAPRTAVPEGAAPASPSARRECACAAHTQAPKERPMRTPPPKALCDEILEQAGDIHGMALEVAQLQSRLERLEQQLEQMRHRAADQETVLNLTRTLRDRGPS
jgi:hypothetical protein